MVVDRLEELRGIGGVDEDRNLEAGAGFPERIEIGIVEMETRAVGLARAQAETLADLADADRARLEIGFELRDRFLRPARSHAREVDAGQHADAVAVRAGANHLQRSRQALARDVVGAEHDAQVEAVHRGDERIQPFRRRDQVHRMAVVVDRRELRLRHRVVRAHQCRMRPVVDDRWGRHLGRLASLRPDLGRARRAFLTRLDRRAAAATSGPAAEAAAPLGRLPGRWLLLLCRRRARQGGRQRDDGDQKKRIER